MPSTGTFSPGRTRSRSPGITSSSGDFGLRAIVANQAGALRREVEQRPDGAAGLGRARNSSTWPSSTRVTITAAGSK